MILKIETNFWCSLALLATLFGSAGIAANVETDKKAKAQTENARTRPQTPKASPESAKAAIEKAVAEAKAAEANRKPLKVIAPDLVVESVEGGIFALKHTPAEGVKNIIFIPSKVSRFPIYMYGYRIKLKTTRNEVKIREKVEGTSIECVNRVEKPVDGYIFKSWQDEKLRKSAYNFTVWIEDVELPPVKVQIN